MGIRKARSSYEEEEEPRAIDGEVQGMRLRELENAVGKEEKGTSTPLVPKQTNMEISHKAGSQGGGNKLLNPFRER